MTDQSCSKRLILTAAMFIPNLLISTIRLFLYKLPLRIEIHVQRSKHLIILDRFEYQKRYINFDINPRAQLLDIGSGGNPFPHATVLMERFLEISKHRQERVVKNDKPLVLADIHNLPFKDKSFDFVYCCHVLEHVGSPIKACAEIIRIGKRGYIETPTFGKDALFVSARDVHKWHVVGIGRNLCFFEYSKRQSEGIRSTAWQDIILGKWYHPLQQVYYDNQDIFNVMFTWSNSFNVFVFRLDGSVEHLN